MPQLGDRPVLVICEGLHVYGDPPWSVSLVTHFLVGCPFQFSCAFLDGSFDVIRGHIHSLGICDGLSQARIGIRITPPDTSRYSEFTDDFRKNLSPLSVLGSFFMFDGMPFRMP